MYACWIIMIFHHTNVIYVYKSQLNQVSQKERKALLVQKHFYLWNSMQDVTPCDEHKTITFLTTTRHHTNLQTRTNKSITSLHWSNYKIKDVYRKDIRRQWYSLSYFDILIPHHPNILSIWIWIILKKNWQKNLF